MALRVDATVREKKLPIAAGRLAAVPLAGLWPFPDFGAGACPSLKCLVAAGRLPCFSCSHFDILLG